MNFSESSPKKRKVEPQEYSEAIFENRECANGTHCVTNVSKSNNILFISNFLDRLRLKTLPHITPLLERLQSAETGNIEALRAIDRINKRIKELEYHVERSIQTKTTSEMKVGADITDPHSEEYLRLVNAIQSSPFAPFKPPTSQSFRQNDSLNKLTNIANTLRPNSAPKNGHTIDLTSEEMLASNKMNGSNNHRNLLMNNSLHNKIRTLPHNIDILSAQFLPPSKGNVLLNIPKLDFQLVRDGICLQWDFPDLPKSNAPSPVRYEISSFQKSEITLNSFPWRKIGEVAALPLPMACTLTYVVKMNTYFFAIRAWLCDDASSPWSNVITVEIN